MFIDYRPGGSATINKQRPDLFVAPFNMSRSKILLSIVFLLYLTNSYSAPLHWLVTGHHPGFSSNSIAGAFNVAFVAEHSGEKWMIYSTNDGGKDWWNLSIPEDKAFLRQSINVYPFSDGSFLFTSESDAWHLRNNWDSLTNVLKHASRIEDVSIVGSEAIVIYSEANNYDNWSVLITRDNGLSWQKSPWPTNLVIHDFVVDGKGEYVMLTSNDKEHGEKRPKGGRGPKGTGRVLLVFVSLTRWRRPVPLGYHCPA